LEVSLQALDLQPVVVVVLRELSVSEGVNNESEVINLVGYVDEDLEGSIVPVEEFMVSIREWGLGVIEVSTLSGIYLTYIWLVFGLVLIGEGSNLPVRKRLDPLGRL
jgi:hypothetical protein